MAPPGQHYRPDSTILQCFIPRYYTLMGKPTKPALTLHILVSYHNSFRAWIDGLVESIVQHSAIWWLTHRPHTNRDAWPTVKLVSHRARRACSIAIFFLFLYLFVIVSLNKSLNQIIFGFIGRPFSQSLKANRYLSFPVFFFARPNHFSPFQIHQPVSIMTCVCVNRHKIMCWTSTSSLALSNNEPSRSEQYFIETLRIKLTPTSFNRKKRGKNAAYRRRERELRRFTVSLMTLIVFLGVFIFFLNSSSRRDACIKEFSGGWLCKRIKRFGLLCFLYFSAKDILQIKNIAILAMNQLFQESRVTRRFRTTCCGLLFI